MGFFNAYTAPTILGLEWAPLSKRLVPYGNGVELGQTFRNNVADSIAYAGCRFEPPGVGAQPYQFHLLCTVYLKGDELDYGTVQRALVAADAGTTSGGGAALGGGAVSEADAISSPSDGKYMDCPTGAFVDPTFATAGRFAGKRILRLVLYHAITITTPPTLGLPIPVMILELGQTGLPIAKYGNIRGDYPGVSAQVRSTDLGEINPQTSGIDHTTLPDRWPWTVSQVQGLNSIAQRFRIRSPEDNIRLHYAALEVVYAEENRLAVGGRRFGSSGTPGRQPASPGGQLLVLRQPDGTLGWNEPVGEFAMTFTVADAGGPYFRVPADPPDPTDVDQLGMLPVGPSLDTFAVFVPHEGREAPRGQDLQLLSADPSSKVMGCAIYHSDFSAAFDTNPYTERVFGPVYGGVEAIQDIVQNNSDSGPGYPYVRFYARRFGDTFDLTVTCDSSTASINSGDFDALPEIIDGIRRVTLRFDAAVTADNSGSNKQVHFNASGHPADRWEILGAFELGLAADTATYGRQTSMAHEAGVDYPSGDFVVSLHRDGPSIDHLSVTNKTFAFEPETSILDAPCPPDTKCLPRNMSYVLVDWGLVGPTGSPPVPLFGYYELQRKDDLDPIYRTIAHVTNQATPSFNDFEFRLGVLSTYRVRACRQDNICGAWSVERNYFPVFHEAEATPGVLIFTSNVEPLRSLAFAEMYQNDRTETFEFPEAATLHLEKMYGRDFQQAFRPLERGGRKFSRTLMLSHFKKPHYGPGFGFDNLRDMCWAQLPYVCVKDEIGNRVFASVNLTTGEVRARSREPARVTYELGHVDIVQVTREPFPGDRVDIPPTPVIP